MTENRITDTVEKLERILVMKEKRNNKTLLKKKNNNVPGSENSTDGKNSDI